MEPCRGLGVLACLAPLALRPTTISPLSACRPFEPPVVLPLFRFAEVNHMLHMDTSVVAISPCLHLTILFDGTTPRLRLKICKLRSTHPLLQLVRQTDVHLALNYLNTSSLIRTSVVMGIRTRAPATFCGTHSNYRDVVGGQSEPACMALGPRP